VIACSHRWPWYGLLAFSLCTKVSVAQQPATPPAQPAAAQQSASPAQPAAAPASALPSPCMPTKWPNKNPISSISPISINDGSVTSLQITGSGLAPTWTVLLCPKAGSNQLAAQPVTDPLRGSTTSSLWALVTVNPGTTGDYAVYISDGKEAYDSGQTLTIGAPDDASYVACSGPAGRGKPTSNLACSFNPLSYQSTYDAFGKGVANRFIAVQVIVRNMNSSYEYLLQDMRIGTPGYVVSSYDKSLPQAISVKAEQFSARAITLRATAATASILTGVAGFETGAVLQDTANIFAGPFQAGLQSFIPNLSAAELATLDNLAFSVKSTVIPKSGAIMVIGFIQSDTIKRLENHPTKAIAKPFKWMSPGSNSFSDYGGTDLENLFKSMYVGVAGTHVQAVNPSQPTLAQFISPGSNTGVLLSVFQSGLSLNIQGTGLNSVTQVQLSNKTDNKTVISAKLQPIGNESSLDPNVDQLVVPPSTSATTGIYDISFILASGSTPVDTRQSITVDGLSTNSGKVGSSITISGAGFGTTVGKVSFAGAPGASVDATPSSATNWTDTTISVTVPTGAQTGNVTVTPTGGTPVIVGSFTITT